MSNPKLPPTFPPPDEKRQPRQPRQSRLVKAEMVSSRLGQFDVTVRNVSEHGIGGQAPNMLQIGERVTILLPGHEPMPGTVRWVAGSRFGIETDQPVETSRLRAVLGGGASLGEPIAGFEIIPPPTAPARRPGLVLGAAKPTHPGYSEWKERG